MGFGIRIMPGVRIRASSRGISAGLGPRVARVHVGTRGVGVSSGIGPFSAYSRIGGGSRPSPRPSLAAYEREVRRAQRQQEFDSWLELNRRLVDFGEVHLRSFPAAQRPTVSPESVDRAAILARCENEATAGIPWHKRAQRRLAKESAAAQAEQEAQAEEARRREAAAQEQAMFDEDWQQLLANDPERVLAALEQAFADNDAPAAAIDCDGNQTTLVMRLPAPEAVVPERMVAETPTGRPTTRKRSKTERNELYTAVLASNVLATVKEAFAIGPGLREARILAIRDDEHADQRILTALYCGRFQRDELASWNWQAVDPVTAIERADGRINFKGRTRELAALDLTDEDELCIVVEQIAGALGWSLNPDSLPKRA